MFGICYYYKSQVRATPRVDVKGQGENKENEENNMIYIYLPVNEEEEMSEAMGLRMCLLKQV